MQTQDYSLDRYRQPMFSYGGPASPYFQFNSTRSQGQSSDATEAVLRRVVAERDSILIEYCTVMSERDKVHEEMDRLSSQLTSANNRQSDLTQVIRHVS